MGTTEKRGGTTLFQALLEVPNNKQLIQLLLEGGKKDRSSAIYQLARQLGEANLPEESVRVLLEFADSRWGKFFDRPDSSVRIESLLEKASEKRTSLVSVTEGIVPLKPSELTAMAGETEWLIEGLLAKNTYGLITGSTGVGKSQIAIQLGISLAKGINWLTHKVERSRVLFSSLEMGVNELQYFNEKLVGGSPLNESEDIFHYLPIGQPLSILTQEGRDFYLQFVEDYDVFIFDTLSSSTHLSMLDEATAPGIVAFFTQLTQSYEKTVVAIGHDVKQQAKDDRAENMYGHRLLIDRSSMVMRVDKAGDGLVITYPKVRLAKPPEPMQYDRSPETLWLSNPMTKVSKDVKKVEIAKDDLFG